MWKTGKPVESGYYWLKMELDPDVQPGVLTEIMACIAEPLKNSVDMPAVDPKTVQGEVPKQIMMFFGDCNLYNVDDMSEMTYWGPMIAPSRMN